MACECGGLTRGGHEIRNSGDSSGSFSFSVDSEDLDSDAVPKEVESGGVGDAREFTSGKMRYHWNSVFQFSGIYAREWGNNTVPNGINEVWRRMMRFLKSDNVPNFAKGKLVELFGVRLNKLSKLDGAGDMRYENMVGGLALIVKLPAIGGQYGLGALVVNDLFGVLLQEAKEEDQIAYVDELLELGEYWGREGAVNPCEMLLILVVGTDADSMNAASLFELFRSRVSQCEEMTDGHAQAAEHISRACEDAGY